MRIITFLFLILSALSLRSQTSIFLGQSLGFQTVIHRGFTIEGMNSNSMVGLHLGNNIMIGGEFSLNALMKAPFNEVGFFGGYSNDRFFGSLSVKTYQSPLSDSDLGIQTRIGWTWPFQSNLAIGPNIVGGVWLMDSTDFVLGVGVIVKTIKQQ